MSDSQERNELPASSGHSSGHGSISASDATKLYLPLGAVLSLAGALVAGHFWLSAQFTEIKSALQAMSYRLDRIEERASDNWTGTDHRLWALELARANPSLVVPTPTTRTGH